MKPKIQIEKPSYEALLLELKYMLSLAEEACIFHRNDPDTDEDILECRKMIKAAEQK